MKKNGFANHADYIITPDQIKPPGPDPMEMKKLEIEDKKAKPPSSPPGGQREGGSSSRRSRR
jgi:hypothetical protein